MTAASTLEYQDRIDNPTRIHIDNQVWTWTRSVSEKIDDTLAAEITTLINLETDEDQLIPVSSTKPTIPKGLLQDYERKSQFLPDAQTTDDRKSMPSASSALLSRMLDYSNYYFAMFRSVVFATLEQIDPALIADTSDPRFSQNINVALCPIAVSQTSFSSSAIQTELLRENDLAEEFGYYVRAARNEQFEDGMSSNFANHIHESIRNNGPVAVNAWECVLRRYGNVYETGEELLRQLGLLQHVPSHAIRLDVLLDNLASSDPRIRDAAGLGLSFLDDPNALASLRIAYQSETESWLRRNFSLVIDQLEAIA